MWINRVQESKRKAREKADKIKKTQDKTDRDKQQGNLLACD